MWALILAGGLGTRLRPLLPNLPKALAPVGNRCFLDYQLEYVRSQGIDIVVLCPGHLSDQIPSHVGDGKRFGLKVYYAEEDKPLGTAGAIRNAYEILDLPETFFVLNGDTYVHWNRSQMNNALVVPDTDFVMMLVRVSNSATGNVRLNANGQVTCFVEKQASARDAYANAGMYLMRRRIVEAWPPGYLSLEYDCLPGLVDQGRIRGVISNGPLYDIGTPEGLRHFEQALLEGRVEISTFKQEDPHEVTSNNRAPYRAAVFLDRDGVINRKKEDYVKTWSEFEFLPGALDAICQLSSLSDFLIFVVTNQSCIGRGLTTLEDVETIHRNMVRMVESYGGRIDDIVVCPHHPNDGCNCRKPEPGMLFALARRHRVSLPCSYMIDDSITDIQAALRAGVQAIHITGEASVSHMPNDSSVWHVKDLQAAVDRILAINRHDNAEARLDLKG